MRWLSYSLLSAFLSLYLASSCCATVSSGTTLSRAAYVVDSGRDVEGSIWLDNLIIPLNASFWQVALSPLELEAFEKAFSADIKSIKPLRAEDKFHPSTVFELETTAQAAVEKKLYVTISDNSDVEKSSFMSYMSVACIDCIVECDARVDVSTPGTSWRISVQVPSTQAKSLLLMLAEVSSVEWVERRVDYRIFNKWATRLVRNDENDDLNGISNLTGEGEIVGIADTGIQMNSCFFIDKDMESIPYNTINMNHRKVVYYNTRYGDTLEGVSGHGTHVAGSIAGESLDSGVKEFRGVAHGAKLAVFDIESYNGILMVPYDLGNIFKPMYDAGARIFSNSWGNPGVGGSANAYTMDSREVDVFMRSYPDSLVIFAAGNSGQFGPNSVCSPSTNKNGLSVGASLNSHNSFAEQAGSSFSKEGVAYFSAIGPTEDNRLKPDILAPGWMIRSASSTNECGVTSKGGTSMAAPMVAGAAALVREYFIKGFYPSGNILPGDGFNPSGALLKAMIIHSGKAMKTRVSHDGSADILPGYPSAEQGYGRMTIGDVLHFGPSEGDFLSLFVRGGARSGDKGFVQLKRTGDQHTYSFKVSPLASPHPIRITLAYTDVAAYPSSQGIVINKLSLLVTANATGEFYDRINKEWVSDNVIVIDLPVPEPNATYIVTITAESLSVQQPYALVMSGEIVPQATASIDGVKFLQKSPLKTIYKLLVLSVLLVMFLFASVVSYMERLFLNWKAEDDLELGLQNSCRERARRNRIVKPVTSTASITA